MYVSNCTNKHVLVMWRAKEYRVCSALWSYRECEVLAVKQCLTGSGCNKGEVVSASPPKPGGRKMRRVRSVSRPSYTIRREYHNDGEH